MELLFPMGKIAAFEKHVNSIGAHHICAYTPSMQHVFGTIFQTGKETSLASIV
jgi:hypothetical protein